jgi:hypothetical protein
MPVGIAGLGFQDTAYLLEIVLGTPKTTPGQVDFFLHSSKLGKNIASRNTLTALDTHVNDYMPETQKDTLTPTRCFERSDKMITAWGAP